MAEEMVKCAACGYDKPKAKVRRVAGTGKPGELFNNCSICDDCADKAQID